MLKIVDVMKIGEMLSVIVEGDCKELKNGSKLVDNMGNVYTVESVGMAIYDDPHDISKTTTLLVTPCTLEKGSELTSA